MINAKRLSYTYPGSKEKAVDGISFSIAPGEIFGFLGPSGAGKSTTQKILTGLLSGWAGEVLIKGKDLTSLGKEYCQQIGVAFEFPNFYQKFTAEENLEFFGSLYKNIQEQGKQALRDRITMLLEAVGLGDAAKKNTADYSKGMKMRLNLCRALIHDPPILYLDEPTSGLDPVNSRNIRKLIKGEAESGKTVFLTTHNMEVASELCDRVAFLNEGELKVVDTPDKLMMAHGAPEVRLEYFSDKANIQKRDFPLSGLGKNDEFISLLNSSQIKTIHSREATLEDVFIALTGRGLE